MNERGKFTEASVAAIPLGRDRIIFDGATEGFGLRVTKSGTKLWIIQASVAGRPRRITIGRFPEMSVARARKAARDALADLRAGRDPKAEQAARAKAMVGGQLTVAAFAEQWLSDHVRKKR